MALGKGYRPDPVHRRSFQKTSYRLFGGGVTVPPSFSAEHLEGSILDQSACGSCCGHGTSQALTVAAAHQGAPLAFRPSPKDIYALVRAKERADAGGPMSPLDDTGAMPSDVMTVLADYGVRAMRSPSPLQFASDVDASNVADEPSLADIEADGQKIITGQYRVNETAEDFIDQLCAGLMQYGAAGLGVFVDRAFEQWSGIAPIDGAPNLRDPDGGGHWVAVTSYRTLADGSRVFRGPNSWSSSWGDGGHYEVTDRWLRAACSDCYLFRLETT